MKIIEYTLGLPPYRRGGLPRYSLDLATELAKDNDVYLLYPGQMMPNGKALKITEVPTAFHFTTYEMKNPLPVSLGLGIQDEPKYYETREIEKFKQLVGALKPDVFHLHTLMGLPLEALQCVKEQGIKIVYTTHDYYGLCPKMLSADGQRELATDHCTDDCMLCALGPSYKKILVMQSHLYQYFKESKLVKKLRKKGKGTIRDTQANKNHFSAKQVAQRKRLREYYLAMFELVDEFHFNSTVAEEYFKRFLPQAQGKVIPITHAGLKDLREQRSAETEARPLRIGYVGPYDHKKGFDLLKQTLLSMEQTDAWQADFYGDIVDDPLFKRSNITNHGVVPSYQVATALQQLDVLVMPSRWHETFGLIGLEALLVGTPCLMSSRVGAKDLVPKDWIFQSEDDLQQQLMDLIWNPQLVPSMKKEVKQLALNHSMADHTRIVYDAVLADKGS